MSRDGSGNYVLPAGQPVVSGQTISSTVHNTLASDLAAALTQSLSKDGQTTPTANQPMGSFRHTGVGNPTARNQYGTVDQIQDGEYILVGSVTGTDTIAGSLAPSITAYVAGMHVVLIPANANTGAATLNLNGNGALDIQKYTSAGQVALAANDLRAGIPALLILDTGGDDWILLNPYSGALGDVTIGTLTATTVNASGTVTGGNLTTAGTLTSATISNSGTITGGNLTTAGAVTTVTVSASGTVTGANLTTAGTLTSATISNSGTATSGTVAATSALTVAGVSARDATNLFNTGNLPDARLTSNVALYNASVASFSSGTFADARIALSNVSQHAGSISTRNVPGLAGTAVTIQSDPGGTPSGTPGDLFFYY